MTYNACMTDEHDDLAALVAKAQQGQQQVPGGQLNPDTK
jgi:hypothetical protein